MRILVWHVVPLALAVAPGCVPRGYRDDEALARSGGASWSGRSGVEKDVTAVGADLEKEARLPRISEARPTALPTETADLEKEARLPRILRIALARHPGLLEAKERVKEQLARVSPSARLPDLELKYEQWGVPLGRPYALDEADSLMLGLRQTFPPPGVLRARESAARQEAEIALDALRERTLDVVHEVEHAYYEYLLADREVRIHLEHVDLTERALDLTRSNFRTGSASEQDVLRVMVELQTVQRDIAQLEQRRRSAAALLNSLMARDADAPLGPAPDLLPTEIPLGLTDLEKLAETKRPEVLAAEHRKKRGEADVRAAERAATWPSFMVGVDYWYMPTLKAPHAYGAMVSVSLPWLNPKHREEWRAAELAASADRCALDSVKIRVRYEVHDAFARYEAARRRYLMTRNDLLPTARQSFEAAQAAFAAGKGSGLALLDALQSLLRARLDEVRGRVELKAAISDLKRAVGADLEEVAITDSPGAHP